MVKAGYLGEKVGPPSTDPEDMRLLFDAIAGGLDTSQAPASGTIQWDFPDAEPWHVVVANGSTRAEPGRASAPTVTLKTRFEDFVDVTSKRVDPRRLVLRGGLRPSGDVRWLWRARRMFPS